MSRSTVQFDDYVSLVVMLLMFVALLGGRSASTALAADDGGSPRSVASTPDARDRLTNGLNDGLTLEADGRLGEQALRVSIAVVGEFSHFRGEDE